MILVLDGVFDTGLAALQDTLSTACDLAPADKHHRFEVAVASIRHAPRTAHGLIIPSVLASKVIAPDFVLVPALGAKTDETLAVALATPEVAHARRLLKKWHDEGAAIAAACTGTFVLAEAGLLNGREATTSWWLAAYFRSCYPLVKLNDTRTLIRAGNIITAGAVLGHFDLALWLIRQSSPSLADLTARYLMLDPRSPQSSYAIPDHVRHNDAVVLAFEACARENLQRGLSIKQVAKNIGVSARTMSRRVQETLGKSPLAYHQDLRVERAIFLLGTTKLSVDEVAEITGYANGMTLRRLIRRKTGRTACAFRRINQTNLNK